MSAETRPLGIAGNLLVFFPLGLTKCDPRSLSLGGIGKKQAARLQPPFVFAELADVEYVAGPQREPIEHGAVPRVRMLAADANVDLTHAIALPLVDIIDKVELPRLLQKPWIGPDVGKDEATTAVDVADQTKVDVHLRLVKRLAAGELEIPREKFALKLVVADKRYVADRIPRPLVDHEGQHRPLALAAVDHFDLAAHLRLEEAEAAIVGGERLDIGIDFGAVEIAADEPEHARLRLDLREEPGVGGNAVADKACPERFTASPLVDEKYSSLVARLAPLDGGHLRGVVALFVIIGFDPAASLLDDVGVHRITHVNLRLLTDGAARHPLVADIFHVPQHRPLHHLENDDHALFDANILRVNVNELAAAMEGANVLLNHMGVKNLAGAGDEFRELRYIGGMVPLDPHLDDAIGLINNRSSGRRRSRGWRQGRDVARELGLGGRDPEPRACTRKQSGDQRFQTHAREHQGCRSGKGRQRDGEEYWSPQLRHKSKSVLRTCATPFPL